MLLLLVCMALVRKVWLSVLRELAYAWRCNIVRLCMCVPIDVVLQCFARYRVKSWNNEFDVLRQLRHASANEP